MWTKIKSPKKRSFRLQSKPEIHCLNLADWLLGYGRTWGSRSYFWAPLGGALSLAKRNRRFGSVHSVLQTCSDMGDSEQIFFLGCKGGQGKLTKQHLKPNQNNWLHRISTINISTAPRSEAKRFMNKCSCYLTVMMWWDSLAYLRSCLECFWKSTTGNSWTWIKPMQSCNAASINMME